MLNIDGIKELHTRWPIDSEKKKKNSLHWMTKEPNHLLLLDKILKPVPHNKGGLLEKVFSYWRFLLQN